MTAITTEPLTVLVTDDEAGIRSLLCSFLESEGYRTVEAEGAISAIEILKNEKIDVIISDVNMPKGNGLELLRWVKSADYRSPSVLLITSIEDVSTPMALDSGADDLLMKPIDFEILLSAVEKVKTRPQDRWTSSTPTDEILPYQLEFDLQSLEHAMDSGVLELGQGGMFLHMKSGYPLSYERVRFSLTFSEGSLLRLSGDGLVRWARPHSVQGYKNGIGVEFRHVEVECQVELVKQIEERKIISFIPDGKLK